MNIRTATRIERISLDSLNGIQLHFIVRKHDNITRKFRNEVSMFPVWRKACMSWSDSRSQLYIIRCRAVQQPLAFLFADRKCMNTVSTQIIGKQQTTIRCKKHTMQMRLALPFLIRSASRKDERITFQQFPATS